jgi:hypothetical protein
MGRNNKQETEFEGLDEDLEIQEEHVEAPRPAKPPEPLRSAPRNLTYERIRATLEGDKETALKTIGEEEVVEVALPKLDPETGEKVRDSLGYLVTESRKVFKRDFISKQWDEKIAKVCGKLERNA